MNSQKIKKVIVIGAGHGGLAVAARLQIKGYQVTVYESSNSAVTIPQVLTLPAAYRDLFLKTGSALEDELELPELDFALDMDLSSGGKLLIPGSGIGRVLTQIEKSINKSAADQWRNYILSVGQLWLKTRNPVVENETKNNFQLVRRVGVNSIIKSFSYQKLVKKHLSNPDLIKLASQYRNHAYVDSSSKLGLLNLNSYVQQTFGVYEPIGGLSALTNALQIRCEQLGVKFRFSQSVSPVSIAHQVVGVQDPDGQLIASEVVIVNDLLAVPDRVSWRNLPTVYTSISGLYRIAERSWLGLGPAHAVLSAELVAAKIGSAAS